MIFFGHLFRQNELGLTEKIDAMNDDLADLWWVVTRWICRRVVLSIGQHEVYPLGNSFIYLRRIHSLRAFLKMLSSAYGKKNTAKSTRKDSNIEHAFSTSSGAIRVKDDTKEKTHVSIFTWFAHFQSSIQRRRVMVGPDTLLLRLSILLMHSHPRQDLKSASTSCLFAPESPGQ
ncbi:hypothetical protein PsorP6_012909 [Peronosclerospora sorghi]|uniref:Uncharacterized protein n=1 Tax=Peronosclerospora sorghi TaxID=230839 RepID=A0ACC0WG34_9STRA|nr:hypothetical protein PsorP6_012909 [Peronosclerospora sorghi]